MKQQSIRNMWSPDPRDGARRKVIDEPDDGAIVCKENEMDAKQVQGEACKEVKQGSNLKCE